MSQTRYLANKDSLPWIQTQRCTDGKCSSMGPRIELRKAEKTLGSKKATESCYTINKEP